MPRLLGRRRRPVLAGINPVIKHVPPTATGTPATAPLSEALSAVHPVQPQGGSEARLLRRHSPDLQHPEHALFEKIMER